MKTVKLRIYTLVISYFLMGFSSNIEKYNEKIIRNFVLKNTTNKYLSLSSYKKAKGFIIVFTCNKCPMAKLYTERLNVLNLKYKPKGFPVIAINPMDTIAYKEETFALMQKKANKEKINFPYLQDKSQQIAKQFGAINTPQGFVILKVSKDKWIVKYEGAIDDSALEPLKANPLIEKAVIDLLANNILNTIYTKSVGCKIFYRGETNKMN